MPRIETSVTDLLYLHGFRSSPRSAKALHTLAWLARHHPAVSACCPQLPPSPAEAIALADDWLDGKSSSSTAIVGSSLGGFYATVLAERHGCRAVLLNPAVEPARDLAGYIGETTAWHSEDRFFFRAEFVDELRALKPMAVTAPERYLAVIAKGDEVLDWREMQARYANCRVELLEGGDHALTGYEVDLLPAVMRFLGLAEAAGGATR